MILALSGCMDSEEAENLVPDEGSESSHLVISFPPGIRTVAFRFSVAAEDWLPYPPNPARFWSGVHYSFRGVASENMASLIAFEITNGTDLTVGNMMAGLGSGWAGFGQGADAPEPIEFLILAGVDDTDNNVTLDFGLYDEWQGRGILGEPRAFTPTSLGGVPEFSWYRESYGIGAEPDRVIHNMKVDDSRVAAGLGRVGDELQASAAHASDELSFHLSRSQIVPRSGVGDWRLDWATGDEDLRYEGSYQAVPSVKSGYSMRMIARTNVRNVSATLTMDDMASIQPGVDFTSLTFPVDLVAMGFDPHVVDWHELAGNAGRADDRALGSGAWDRWTDDRSGATYVVTSSSTAPLPARPR